MSLLLDTQALMWYVLDDSRLTSKAKDAIETETGNIFVSPASLWEIAIKIGAGKYELDDPFEEFWGKTLPESKLTMLPLEIRHMARIIELPHIHRDPFDRIIVAQALTETISLVSSDSLLDRYGIQRIW